MCCLWESCRSPLAVTSPDASVKDGAPTLSLLQAVLGTALDQVLENGEYSGNKPAELWRCLGPVAWWF